MSARLRVSVAAGAYLGTSPVQLILALRKRVKKPGGMIAHTMRIRLVPARITSRRLAEALKTQEIN
jgi:hypothetical protein